jgi:hypothetical protein
MSSQVEEAPFFYRCLPLISGNRITKTIRAKAVGILDRAWRMKREFTGTPEEERSGVRQSQVEQLLLELKLTDDLQEQVDLANMQFTSFHLTLQMETDDDGDGTPIPAGIKKVEKVIS